MKYNEWLKNIKGFSQKTIEIYEKYAFELEVCGLDYERLINRYSEKAPSTKRLILSACKSYYIFKSDERANKIELPKKNIVVSDYVTYEEYEKYCLKINKKSKMGFQKYLIIKILFETGIRASELLHIRKRDIHKNRIKILGKGNKERFISISNWLSHDLSIYLENLKTEWLFNFGYKNLRDKIQRLDKNRRLTPHMFRHGFARYCNKKGISVYDISIFMGHSSIETTTKYINKNSEDVTINTIF